MYFSDLLHLGGLGHSSALGTFPQGHQSQSPHHHIGPSWANSDTYYEGRNSRSGGANGMNGPTPTSPPQQGGASSGSDVLDSNANDTKLDKSNILLLGPTGSGNCLMPSNLHIILFAQLN